MKKSKMIILFVSALFAILLPSTSQARSANVSIIKENNITFNKCGELKKVQQLYYFLDFDDDGLCDYVCNNSYFANSFGDYTGTAASSLNLKFMIKPGTFAGKTYSAKEIENLLANKNYEMGGIAYDESCHFGLNSNQKNDIYNAYDYNNSSPKLIFSISPSLGVCTLEIQAEDTLKINSGSMTFTNLDETTTDQNEQMNFNIYQFRQIEN